MVSTFRSACFSAVRPARPAARVVFDHRAPLRQEDETRLDQLETGKEPFYLSSGAHHQGCRCLVVNVSDLSQRCLVPVLAGHMRDNKVASGAQCVAELSYAAVRIILVPDIMKHQRHTQCCESGV